MRRSSRNCCAVLTLALVAAAAPLAIATHIEEPLGYRIGPCSGTDDKPQSKLWFNDGSFWAVLDGADGDRIFELVHGTWQPHASPDAILGGHDGRADVLWDGKQLLVLQHAKKCAFFQFTYDHKTRLYHLAPGFPVLLAIPKGSETMAFDADSRGRLWATYVVDDRVYVTHSTADHKTWDVPGTVLCDSLSDDDISAVIAFGGHSIGIMWSDEDRDEFGFCARHDDWPEAQWAPTEVVFKGPGNADDHVHLAADAAGRVYAITKDDRHHLSAHLRDAHGTWQTQENVLRGGDATRPTLQVAPDDGLLYLIYTRWHEGGEAIAYRAAPLGELRFGEANVLIDAPGVDFNDVTGVKGPLPRGTMVAVACGKDQAWWNGWGQAVAGTAANPHDELRLHASALRRVPGVALALAFDEPAGAQVADGSAFAAGGQLGGPWADDTCEPQHVAGRSGGALHFDGVYDYVQVVDAPQLDITGSVTIDAWIRRHSHDTKDAVLCKGTRGARTYQVRLLKDDQVEFLREAGGGKNHVLVGKHTCADTLWHHVECVFDSSAGQSRIFVDGHLDVAAPDSGRADFNDAPLCIGARFGDDDLRDLFHGDIDQVRISRGARHAADFTPETEFPNDGMAGVFLEWTPRFAGPHTPAEFDVFRAPAGGGETKLTPVPLASCTFLVSWPSEATVRYRVQTVATSSAKAAEIIIDPKTLAAAPFEAAAPQVH